MHLHIKRIQALSIALVNV